MHIRLYFYTIFFSLLSTAVYAQDSTSADSLRNDSKSATFYQRQFAEEKQQLAQERLLISLKACTDRTKAYLKNMPDTTAFRKEFKEIEAQIAIASDGVFTNTGSSQTYRNLVTSDKVLAVLKQRLAGKKQKLETYISDMVQLRLELDSLSGSPELYTIPSDTAEQAKLKEKIELVALNLKPAFSNLKKAIAQVKGLANFANALDYSILSKMDDIDLYEKELSENAFSAQFRPLWEPPKTSRPFSEILFYSLKKTTLLLYFYTQKNFGKIFLLSLLAVGAFAYLRSLKSILKEQNLLRKDLEGQLVLRRPMLSAILLVLNIFQFIFPDPPLIFNAIIWAISGVCLTYIFKGYVSKYWARVWLAFFSLFVISTADNIILQASRAERWGMLILAFVSIVVAVLAMLSERKRELREQWILYSIGLLALVEFLSIITNIYGALNFSKTLLASGFINVIVAIQFLWTIRLINEGLKLAVSVYTAQDKRLFYVNFAKVGDRAPGFFYLFLIVGWAILFGRNFYSFKSLTQPIVNFFTDQHAIGSYSFSISSLLLFMLIMLVATITSKIVSYFASDRNDGNIGKQGIGSYLLLVRIAIISIGLFLAFAAAGIAMDKLTIVVGALGVGIGFGMQTLVNNLVSGLIIAFEKPVNVGDVVEINNNTGVMKSIGFRSSIIATWDGADVVMPNGDLLNSNLINWSSSSNHRRMNIVVGVAYGTNLQLVEQVLLDMLIKEPLTLKNPQPELQFVDFDNSAILVKILFWVKLKDAFSARSLLVRRVNDVLADNNIVIPFPQTDVHISELPKPKES